MGCSASAPASSAGGGDRGMYTSGGPSGASSAASVSLSTTAAATSSVVNAAPAGAVTIAPNPFASPPPNARHSDPKEISASSSIDRNLDRARQQEELKIKLLLLGAGESGKSTIFKQMRILHGNPRSDDDLRMYGVVVRSNVITAMRKLCGLLRSLGLEAQLEREDQAIMSESSSSSESQSPSQTASTISSSQSQSSQSQSQQKHQPNVLRDNDNDEDAKALRRRNVMYDSPKQAYDLLMAHLVDNTGRAEDLTPVFNGEGTDWVGESARAGLGANNDAKLFLCLWKPIKTLWETKTMKEVWSKRAAVNVIDGHKEYLLHLPRLASPKFKPTPQDVLLARVKTTQVVIERYRIDGIEFEMYDVGGQRSERKKWIDCFESVDAVIFVAALSEYDQCLAESRRTNRMVESLDLFRSVCNNRAFANTSIMLFLNKKDVFAEKIMYSDIAAQRPFADYAGPPRDFNAGVLYFMQKFKDCLIDDDFNDSLIHVTCATDTNNMEFVLDRTRTIIMTDNLRRSGFLGP